MTYEWRYLYRGRAKHSVNVEAQHANAQCGRGPELFECWYGTGSQDEYDRVSELPACGQCMKIGPVPLEEKK